MRDIKITSIQAVDMSDLNFPIIAVCKHPEDYPQHYVARIFDCNKPTNVVIVKETLKEIQDDIEKHTDKFFIPRLLDDLISVVGTWL